MLFNQVYIPYGSYWSTPFARWQGSLANLNAIPFAADVTRRALDERKISPEVFDALFLGITVPQKPSFYGAPWLAGLIGAAMAHTSCTPIPSARAARATRKIGCGIAWWTDLSR